MNIKVIWWATGLWVGFGLAVYVVAEPAINAALALASM